MATIGDAIESFMKDPDPTTEEVGMLELPLMEFYRNCSQSLSFEEKTWSLFGDSTTYVGRRFFTWRGKSYRWKHVLSYWSYGMM